MGLIKSAISVASGVISDQYKEYFIQDSIDPKILIVKGEKRTSAKSFNNKGSENIITKGSAIAVSEGQCMLIVENGKVADICSEAGVYTYDNSTEPSIFCGNLKDSVIDSFKVFAKRFTYGGETGNDQRVYYINLKEILGNKYGTLNPVPFRVVDNNIGLDMDISIRCNGEFSYKITNPMLFYVNVCGNVTMSYSRDSIDSMLKTELLTALQPAFAQISAQGVRYSALAAHTMEIANALNDILSEKWRDLRGIEIVSFGINSAVASKEDEAMIKELQKTAVYGNAKMAAARLTDAQAEAMVAAASNEGQGALLAFAGLNIANQATGVNSQALFQMANEGQNAQGSPIAQNGWNCSCGAVNTDKFCAQCGKSAPVSNQWVCSCGKSNEGKFCTNCGSAQRATIKCDKCGWTPKDSGESVKFCPECGDIIDANDR